MHRRISILVLLVAAGAAWSVGSSIAATPPPNTFGIRLVGFAVETNQVTTATAITPRSGYSFAKLYSSRDLDGGRSLDMEARGANEQYNGFEGAVIFVGGDVPINGNNLPGYTQAFFPSFEGFYPVSEKCALNQTEAKETPECRGQSGPYALARVVPDQAAPMVEGIARNQGDATRGETFSSSRIVPNDDGTVTGTQHNEGRNQQVPGTPIEVSSFLAEVTVTSALSGSTAAARCTGEVTVAGQKVDNNRELQQALAAFNVAGGLRVVFTPPSKPEILALPGGGAQASCHGPRFEVVGDVQGGSGVIYTFGDAFGVSGVTENVDSGTSGEGGTTPTTAFEPVAPPPATGGSLAGPTGTGSDAAPPGPSTSTATTTATTTPSTGPESEVAGGPELVRETIDAMPVGLLTGVAATLLPLGVWLLFGVTGSLARGSTRLRLPPFRDDLDLA